MVQWRGTRGTLAMDFAPGKRIYKGGLEDLGISSQGDGMFLGPLY